MVAEAGRERTRSWEAGDGWRKETDLTKTKADPAARVDGVVVESRGSGAHVEFPWIVAPGQSNVGEVGTAGEIGRKGDK